MPKLKPDTQRARRERILDAAERSFARSGFHRCTMQDICSEAGISPGALYVYFSSKEELISGLAERDRAEFQARFAGLSAAPDFMKALTSLGEQYFVEEPAHKRLMCVEIGIESTRNPQVGEIFRSVDAYVTSSFEELFARLEADGRIAPDLDIATLAKVFSVIGDGMVWRRAIHPDFDSEAVMPGVVALITKLLNPSEAARDAAAAGAEAAQ